MHQYTLSEEFLIPVRITVYRTWYRYGTNLVLYNLLYVSNCGYRYQCIFG
jgi:hypothetical protein